MLSVPAARLHRVTLELRITPKGPLDFDALLDWYRVRALPAVEVVDESSYRRAVALPHGPGVIGLHREGSEVVATLDLDDQRDAGDADVAVRRLLDLDHDPDVVGAHLSTVPALADLVAAAPGVRIPGTTTPIEAALRALTGQQVSVAAGRSQLERMVGDPGPRLRPFPSAEQVLAGGMDWFAGPAARRQAIHEVLTFAAAGGLDPDADPARAAAGLLAVRGVGPWTVAYTLMRGYGLPDVDLSGDRALVVALQRLAPGEPLKAVLAQAAPWRSYAALHLWRAG